MKIFLLLFFSFLVFAGPAISQKALFDKAAFYEAMESDKAEQVNAQLEIVKAFQLTEKNAYEGALLMKKAGLVSKAKEKLSLFKAGRTKLEAAIAKDNTNTEFVFLRLIIQEHAQKIVKYNKDLESDSKQILVHYKSLAPALQKAIQAYSKKSKLLKTLQS